MSLGERGTPLALPCTAPTYHSQIRDLSKVDPRQCSVLHCFYSKYCKFFMLSLIAFCWNRECSHTTIHLQTLRKHYGILKTEMYLHNQKILRDHLSAAVHMLVLQVSRHWFQWGLPRGNLKQGLSNRIEHYGPNFSMSNHQKTMLNNRKSRPTCSHEKLIVKRNLNLWN